MANQHRGQVDLKAGDKIYTLSFSINAMCELEDLLGEPISQIAKSLGDPQSVRMSTVRALVWAALRDHHSDIDLKGAGDLVAEATVTSTMETIGRAFALAFPDTASKSVPKKAVKA